MNGTSLRASCCAIALGGVLAGCEKSAPPAPAEPPPSPAAPAAAPTPPPPTAVATAPSVPLEAVPAREQFEEEAEKQITPANLEKQLQALEKELAAE